MPLADFTFDVITTEKGGFAGVSLKGGAGIGGETHVYDVDYDLYGFCDSSY